MRRDESKTVKEVIEYQPSGKRLRDRPRKRWFEGGMSEFKITGHRRLEGYYLG